MGRSPTGDQARTVSSGVVLVFLRHSKPVHMHVCGTLLLLFLTISVCACKGFTSTKWALSPSRRGTLYCLTTPLERSVSSECSAFVMWECDVGERVSCVKRNVWECDVCYQWMWCVVGVMCSGSVVVGLWCVECYVLWEYDCEGGDCVDVIVWDDNIVPCVL